MKTIPKPANDHLTQASHRAIQEDYEKFVQQGIDRWHKQRATKERQESESSDTGMPRCVAKPVEPIHVS